MPIDNVFASNFADDFAPQSTGSRDRVTLIDTTRSECLRGPEAGVRVRAAQIWEADPEDIEVADNEVYVRAAQAEHWMTMTRWDGGQLGREFLVGTGSWSPTSFTSRSRDRCDARRSRHLVRRLLR